MGTRASAWMRAVLAPRALLPCWAYIAASSSIPKLQCLHHTLYLPTCSNGDHRTSFIAKINCVSAILPWYRWETGISEKNTHYTHSQTYTHTDTGACSNTHFTAEGSVENKRWDLGLALPSSFQILICAVPKLHKKKSNSHGTMVSGLQYHRNKTSVPHVVLWQWFLVKIWLLPH